VTSNRRVSLVSPVRPQRWSLRKSLLSDRFNDALHAWKTKISWPDARKRQDALSPQHGVISVCLLRLMVSRNGFQAAFESAEETA
jgi:hypothetical protein